MSRKCSFVFLWISEGYFFFFGVIWDGFGVNFVLFLVYVIKVELCLFDVCGEKEIECIELFEYIDEIWYGYLFDVYLGQIYGYWVYGFYELDVGYCFNFNKLFFDFYVKQLVGCLCWFEVLFGYIIGLVDVDFSFDECDSVFFVFKLKVIDLVFIWVECLLVCVFWDCMVIYEVYLCGFSMCYLQVLEVVCGIFVGLMNVDLLVYICWFGVISVELLLIYGFVDDKYLLENGMSNYWGYNSIVFFVLYLVYFVSGQVNEFKEMVVYFYDVGLELIFDVVYNYIVEGNELGLILCMCGIDNVLYYCLMFDQCCYYINDFGIGNIFDFSYFCVLQMVIDLLCYWVMEMCVDGFCFDLVIIFGCYLDGFDECYGFFVVCCQDLVLSKCKLIVEFWDCGFGGYQVGGFLFGWVEWNDCFCDCVCVYWCGDDGMLLELVWCLIVFGDFYDQCGWWFYVLVNFVIVYDGFILCDVVFYDYKYNEVNGENNVDGSDYNLFWNYGCEGFIDDLEICVLCLCQMCNLLFILLLFQGILMLVVGDEFSCIQQGNNNVYCQDNELGWIDWWLDDEGCLLLVFIQCLLVLC